MGLNFKVDIEIFDKKDDWEQGKFLVHGCSDVLWTDNLEDAIKFLKASIKEGIKTWD